VRDGEATTLTKSAAAPSARALLRGCEGSMLDTLVVGAGPHALSLVARLVDDTPDLLTEPERVRMMSDGMKGTNATFRGRSHALVRKHLNKRFDGAAKLRDRVLVIDLHGSWMSQWERDFESLQIPHTRSHVHLHPDPYDFQSLEVWARMHRRDSELWHMDHMDRKASNARGYKGPFLLPGTALFNDFCRSLVKRYNLEPLVQQGRVEDIRIVESLDKAVPCTFKVNLADGSVIAARRVVCALGPGPLFRGMVAKLPWWADELASLSAAGHAHSCRLMHFVQLVPWILAGGAEQLQGRRVLVVGGGQTAGHLALLAVHKGSEVTMAARRRLVQKPYDIDLEHVGTWRAESLQRFWAMDTWERVRYIRRTRNGGSVSHEVYLALQAYAKQKSEYDKSVEALDKQKRDLAANLLVLQTIDHMINGKLADAAGVEPGKESASDISVTVNPHFAKISSLMAKVVVPKEFKEAHHDVNELRAILQQAGSKNNNLAMCAPQRSIASIAKCLQEIETKMEKQKRETGGLELLEEVEVTRATWRSDSRTVSGRVEANLDGGCQSYSSAAHSENDGEVVVRFDSGALRSYDFVWLATGGELDMNLVPLLASLQAQRPIPTADSLPRLQADLSWSAGTVNHHTQLHTQMPRQTPTQAHPLARTHTHQIALCT